MKHKAAAKSHVCARIRQRFGRVPHLRDIDSMRKALKWDNEDCFMRMCEGDKIRGIVRYQNIYVSAVYSRVLDGLLTVGCPLNRLKKNKK